MSSPAPTSAEEAAGTRAEPGTPRTAVPEARHPSRGERAAQRGAAGMGRRLRAAARRLLRTLPQTPAGDRLHALAHFVYAHRRLPRRGSGLFNDRLFFLKTGPAMREPLRRITSDKVDAKHFIDGVIGRKVTPETHAVFDSVDAIRREDLPARCVLKPAHGGDVVVFLESADTPLTAADRETLRRGLAMDLYRENREPQYRDLRKRILCEELVGSGETIKDYKVFCHRGRARAIFVCHHWHAATKPRMQNYYDADWNPLPIMQNHRPCGPWEERPARLDEMRALAERLAAHFDCVRVDMYLERGRVFVGELTHCHNQANAVFRSLEEERLLHRLIFE